MATEGSAPVSTSTAASPTAMAASPISTSHPVPLRSPDSPSLHHPTPDLQSLQGAYVGNIERLEDHAERMSEQGSDLGEEIRKLQLEQKESDSRRSSLRSIQPVDDTSRPFGSRSRNASTSSYTNSIVDVNGTARWGGYSPGGFVTSPVGSLRSGSFSPQVPLSRQRSGSRASRLGQVIHTEEREEERGYEHHTPLEQPESPQSHRSIPRSIPRDTSPQPTNRSVSSFTKKYDQIAQEIHEEFQNSPRPEDFDHGPQRHHDVDTSHYQGHHDLPDRPPTAASTDTTHQARVLWQDFDGVHCPDTVPEEEPEPTQGSGSRNSSLMKSPPQMPIGAAPPPDDGMVFYPAPVPQMLNLPKRLSKLPAANVQARRRTQLLDSMQEENRKSAPWLSEYGADSSKQNNKPMDPRKSRQSLAGLPPQLRASAYFDQVGAAQEFEVKGESAADTLDSILEASAHAPVSAFTDHPFAGHVGDEVYGREKHTRKASKGNALDKPDARKSRSSINLLDNAEGKERNRRSSINLLDTRRNSSGDPLNKLKKRNSSADLNMLTIRANESRMSLGAELDDPDPHARGPEPVDGTTPTRRSFEHDDDLHPEDRDEEDEIEEDNMEEEEEDEPYFGPPTTLLAELQMRKQQQKSRNLTAATAFPNGMHATLLELDAVAEIEKRKRKDARVNLAWEAGPTNNPEDDNSDDDVPLGVLFPGKEGLINKRGGGGNGQQQANDWDRPLGLIAKRELEDNEPLSKRRTRLIGGDSNKRHTQLPQHSSQHLEVPPAEGAEAESEEDEGETLAQRVRRLKDRQALDNALDTDVRKSMISVDFASEMMSQFSLNEEGKTKPSPSPGNEEEEETLGQRRARLQAEALARGDVNPLASRPPLRGSMSMANILSAHPIDNTNQARKVSDEQLLNSLPQGSLLHQNAMKQSQREADRMDRNQRISSYGTLDQPLLGSDVGKVNPEQAVAAKIQAYKNKLAGAGTPQTAPIPGVPSMMFSPMGGMGPAMSSMNLPGQQEGYFPQANMGMGIGMGMNMQHSMSMNNLNRGNMPNQFVYPNQRQSTMPQQMMGMNMGMMGMQMNGMNGMNGMQGMNPYGQMGGMPGMRQSSMSNLPTMGAMGGMTMQQQHQMMMMEPPMDPRRRDMIDQWRSGVH